MSDLARSVTAGLLAVLAAILTSFWLPSVLQPEVEPTPPPCHTCQREATAPVVPEARLDDVISCLTDDPDDPDCLEELFLLHVGTS